MTFTPHPALRCPLDDLPLQQQGQCMRCESGHSFDIARQGYVNLLGAQDKRSRDPGDSKAMIVARRNFLDAGHYLPVATALSNLIAPLLTEEALLVDSGCGEGYYLQILAEKMRNSGKPPPALLGFDISKWAVQAAARRFAATWLVASSRQIPLAGQSADMVLSAFGFPDYTQFLRILKENGLLVLVNAGPRHLIQLRELIYADVRHGASSFTDEAVASGFATVEQLQVRYDTATLDQQTLQQLLLMTPHLFRASSEGKRKAASLSGLQLTVDVVIDLLQIKGAAASSSG